MNSERKQDSHRDRSRDIGERPCSDEKVQDMAREHDSQALNLLQADAKLFLTMSDIAPVMLWMAGLDKGCYYFNKGWLDFTGSSLEQQTGNQWAQGVHPEDLERCMAVYISSFDRRESFRMEYRLRRNDGEYRWILDSGTPWFHPDGSFAGYIGSCIDINDQKQLALLLEQRVQERTNELAKLTEKLLKSNVELQQFAYIAAHDLREPLRTITSFAHLLSQEYKGRLSQDADENIDFILDAGLRMQQLITDLLTYSRVETQAKAFAQADCEQILDKTLAGLKASIDEAAAKITRDKLPTVLADASQLSQLFANLLGNALKFRGQNQPVIHVSACLTDGEWLFSVRDNGIGIDEKYVERVFQMFQRLHGVGEYSGTGIGLAICKRIVEHHGGKIWFKSLPGHGSEFFFTLPAKEI